MALTLLLLAAISIKFGRRGFRGTTNGCSPLAALALFLALPVASATAQFCESHVECNDGDVCTFDECYDTTCWNTPTLYGDIAGPDGCGSDGVVDEFDVYAVEDAFEDIVTEGCAPDNADIKSANACEPDGKVDLSDILAVLSAFAGTPNCECFLIGACCGDEGGCTTTTESECPGTYQGDGSECGPVGACCFGDGTCEEMHEICCLKMGADPQGEEVPCQEGLCAGCAVEIAGPTIICKGKPETFTATGTPAGGTCVWSEDHTGGDGRVTINSPTSCSTTITGTAASSVVDGDVTIKVKYTPRTGDDCTQGVETDRDRART